MKEKKTREQIAAERQQKIGDTLNSFQVQLVKLGKQKSYLLGKMSEARRNGLKAQEQQARGLLRNCLAHEKRVLGMQMQLDLAVQSRDLSDLQQSFLECVGTLADEIEGNVSKSTVKKSKKKYVKSLFNLSNDVLTGTNTIAAVSGAINQNQQDIADAMNIGMQNATFNASSLPESLAVPGTPSAGIGAGKQANASFGTPASSGASAPSFGAAPANFNPFAKQEEGELSKYSANQLNGTVNLLTRQIEDKEDRLADLKSERAALDKKMEKLLRDYQTLPPAKAKVLEPEIRAAKSRIDSSNFQLNNLNQELIQLNNNLSMIQKMLSLKERDMASKAVNQTMGGNLDLKGLSVDIANQVNKNNESVKLSEDVNVVSNADNIEFGTGAIDLGSPEDVQKSNEFDDLMKMYNIGEKKNG